MCLSYVWNFRPMAVIGDYENRSLLLNGRKFEVRENLFEFLHMARSSGLKDGTDEYQIDLRTPLWIDAICIDQSNLSERALQVAQMGDIYSYASHVHIWLGKHIRCVKYRVYEDIPAEKSWSFRKTSSLTHPLEHSFFALAAQLPEEPEFDFDDMTDGLILSRINSERLKLKEVVSMPWKESLLSQMFNNIYWQRAWTLQERCLAKSFTFWLDTIPVDIVTVRSVVASMEEFNSEIGERLISLDFTNFISPHFSTERLSDNTKDRPHLCILLDTYCESQCADPRDRIYSLLALCSEQSRVPVDYRVDTNILAYRVLQCHPQDVCVCCAAKVAKSLELKLPEHENNCQYDLYTGPWVEFDVSQRHFKPKQLDGDLYTLIDVSWTCGFFDKMKDQAISYDPNIPVASIGKTERGILTLRIALSLLPELLPDRVGRCVKTPGWNPDARARFGWSVRDSEPSVSDTIPVTIFMTTRGCIGIRMSLHFVDMATAERVVSD